MINVGFPGSFHPCVHVEVPAEVQMEDDGLMEPGMPIYWYVRARDENLPVEIIAEACGTDEPATREMLGQGERLYCTALECYRTGRSVQGLRAGA